MHRLLKITLLLGMLLPGWLYADSLDEILALKEAPTGVVIEIVKSGAADLEELLPKIQNATRQLRKRFPDLPVAVVSHGQEQFALTSNNIKNYNKLETGVKNLVSDDVDVHVCATHASWYDITPEDYPDYIDVSPTGPAQINDYVNLGYIMLDL
ncbi:MAG: DsrE family protein [Gammaproteobacteria bacterium]|nr:DsrE family protein [Gammaproteobacteria bacterium]